MNVDDFHLRIIFQVFSQFAQENIHAAAVKVVIVMPNADQGLFPGKNFVFSEAQ